MNNYYIDQLAKKIDGIVEAIGIAEEVDWSGKWSTVNSLKVKSIPDPWEGTLVDFIYCLTDKISSRKKEGFAIIPATFYPNKTRAGSNVKEVTFLSFDFDNVNPENLKKIIETLFPETVYVLHNTYNDHNNNIRKIRLHLPLLCPVVSQEHRALLKYYFQKIVEIDYECVIDTKCIDPCRGFYTIKESPYNLPIIVVANGNLLNPFDLPTGENLLDLIQNKSILKLKSNKNLINNELIKSDPLTTTNLIWQDIFVFYRINYNFSELFLFLSCLWHSPDENPSLIVYDNTDSVEYQKPFFRCFSCGKYGDLIDFVKQYRSLTFVEAIQELKEIAESVGKSFNFEFSTKKDKNKIEKKDGVSAKSYDCFQEPEPFNRNYKSVEEIREELADFLFEHTSDSMTKPDYSNIFLAKVSTGVGKTKAVIDFICHKLFNYKILIISPTIDTVNEITDEISSFKLYVPAKVRTMIKFVDNRMVQFTESSESKTHTIKTVKVYGLLGACELAHKQAEKVGLLTEDDFEDKEFKLYKQQEGLLASGRSGKSICKSCKLRQSCEYIKFNSKRKFNNHGTQVFVATHQKSKYALDKIISKVKPDIIFFDEDITKTLIETIDIKFFDLLQIKNRLEEFKNTEDFNTKNNRKHLTIFSIYLIINSVVRVIEKCNQNIIYGETLHGLINKEFKEQSNYYLEDMVLDTIKEIRYLKLNGFLQEHFFYNKYFILRLLSEIKNDCKNLFVCKNKKGKKLIIKKYKCLPNSLMKPDSIIPVIFLDATMSPDLLQLAVGKQVNCYEGYVEFTNLKVFQCLDNTFTASSFSSDSLFNRYITFIKDISKNNETKEILVVSPVDIKEKLVPKFDDFTNVIVESTGKTLGTNKFRDKDIIIISDNKVSDNNVISDYLTLNYKNDIKEDIDGSKELRLVPTGYINQDTEEEYYISEYQFIHEGLKLIYESQKNSVLAQSIARINRDLTSDKEKIVYLFARHSLKEWNIIPSEFIHLEKKINNPDLHHFLTSLVTISLEKVGFWSFNLKREERDVIINELNNLFEYEYINEEQKESEPFLYKGLIYFIENVTFFSNNKVSSLLDVPKASNSKDNNIKKKKERDIKTVKTYLDRIYNELKIEEISLPLVVNPKNKIYIPIENHEESFEKALLYYSEHLSSKSNLEKAKSLMDTTTNEST